MKKGRILVAMSGGVDSSVAAFLLKEEGFDVSGATLLLSRPPRDETEKTGKDAAEVCSTIGIPHHVIDIQDVFQHEVVDYFCNEYLQARTPNPCIRCNRQIKFGLLMDRAGEMGIEFLATGHYARVEEDPRFPGSVLKRGVDSAKDQSYALFALDRERLGRIILPMGSLTKNRAREIAADAGLHVSQKDESQDICFIPDGDYSRFITERCGLPGGEGPIKNRKGEILGLHKGLYRYTIGQRRGLGIGSKRPLYVLELIPSENAVIVGFEEEAYQDEFEVIGVNWLVPPPEKAARASVKIRYASRDFPANIDPLAGSQARIRPEAPQKAITPGQAAVFYDRDVVLGGGWIA
jgi:tRNA-specific 2-thiouridylase